MSSDKLKFECRECGSTKLGYNKYVKCITPVTIKDDGQIEYGLSDIDEDEYLCVDNAFVCMDCKHVVKHCGVCFETESELLDYLKMNPRVRQQQQEEYYKKLFAEITAQVEQEKEDLLTELI